jgi:hypothetical protein
MIFYISYGVAGRLVFVFGYELFRIFFGNSVEAIKEELRKARGDEFNKLLRGDFGKALEGQFVEFKIIFFFMLMLAMFFALGAMLNAIISDVFERLQYFM